VTAWYVAPALLALRDELNERYPDRDHASDGFIGDPAHAARDSDHNPDWDSQPPGVVRAGDYDSNGAPGVLTPLVQDLLTATIGDERVWYVIWDGKLYSRTYGWQPRVYHGTNPHDHHGHVSLQGMNGITQARAHQLAFDTSTWLTETPGGDTLPAVRLHRVVEASRHPRKEWAPVNVRRVQRALVAVVPRAYRPEVTGMYDAHTRTAVQAWQRHLGYTGKAADGVLGVKSGTLLGAGRFRLLP
jgi:hypothetical protein